MDLKVVSKIFQWVGTIGYYVYRKSRRARAPRTGGADGGQGGSWRAGGPWRTGHDGAPRSTRRGGCRSEYNLITYNCTVWKSTNCTYLVEEIYSKLRTKGKIALLQSEEASCKNFFELEISIVYRSWIHFVEWK